MPRGKTILLFELDLSNGNGSFHQEKYPTAWSWKVQLQTIVDLKPLFSFNSLSVLPPPVVIFLTSHLVLQSISDTNQIICTFVSNPHVFWTSHQPNHLHICFNSSESHESVSWCLVPLESVLMFKDKVAVVVQVFPLLLLNWIQSGVTTSGHTVPEI